MQITRIQQLGVLAPHQRIKDDMLELIRKQVWKQGENIPGENALAEKYGVSRITVRKALKYLEDAGVLVARQGSGRIVAKAPENSGKSKAIGVICNRFGSAYGEVELLNSLAEKHGFSIHLYLLQDMPSESSLSLQVQQMSDENMAGIIILCRDILGEQVVEWNRYLPIVSIYQDFTAAGILSFTINWRWVAYEAATCFFETGFDQHLILLNEFPFFKHVNEMIAEGFDYAYHLRGRELDPSRIFLMPSERQPNRLKYLDGVYGRLAESKKCGIFSYWNWPLLQLTNYCRSRNLAIPGDVSMIGAIDSEMLKGASMAVTAFEYDRNKLVENAFLTLLERINGAADNPNDIHLNGIYGKLIRRATTL